MENNNTVDAITIGNVSDNAGRKPDDKCDNHRADVQKQLRYTAALDIFQYIFSGLLTISVIIFCGVQLIRLPADSSNIYVTIMVGLVLVWVPVKNVKSKITKKLAQTLAGNEHSANIAETIG